MWSRLDPVETGRQLPRDAEDWWIERIHEFFKARPLAFRTDASKSLQAHAESLSQSVLLRESFPKKRRPQAGLEAVRA